MIKWVMSLVSYVILKVMGRYLGPGAERANVKFISCVNRLTSSTPTTISEMCYFNFNLLYLSFFSRIYSLWYLFIKLEISLKNHLGFRNFDISVTLIVWLHCLLSPPLSTRACRLVGDTSDGFCNGFSKSESVQSHDVMSIWVPLKLATLVLPKQHFKYFHQDILNTLIMWGWKQPGFLLLLPRLYEWTEEEWGASIGNEAW